MTDKKLLAKHELWYRGNLRWKLHPHQKKMYDIIKQADATDGFILLCSRRTGKTYTNLIIAFEECLQNPNHIVNFASTTQKELKRAVYPAIQEMLKDCPEDLKPKFNTPDSVYKFNNGSRLIIAGSNNGHQDDLRGGTSHLNIIDEAGQIDNLKYLLTSVMNPMTATTLGRTIIASTPAPTSGHDFFDISERARARGTFIRFTIHDSGHLTQQAIDKIHKECMEGDSVSSIEESDTFRREYLCEWITDSNLKIIKAWKGDFKLIKQADTKNDLYKFWHKYTMMDLGFKKDFTSILFGHYNFLEARLYIESEYVNKGVETITSKLQHVVLSTEKQLWGDEKPYRRISDNNEPRVIADLGTDYGVWFTETDKESLKAMVNQVSVWVEDGRIAVDPSCTQLLGCLEFGIWNTIYKDFDRTEAYGHYDALASLIYGVRNINEHLNPVPTLYNLNHAGYRIPPEMLHNTLDRKTSQALETMFPMAIGKKR